MILLNHIRSCSRFCFNVALAAAWRLSTKLIYCWPLCRTIASVFDFPSSNWSRIEGAIIREIKSAERRNFCRRLSSILPLASPSTSFSVSLFLVCLALQLGQQHCVLPTNRQGRYFLSLQSEFLSSASISAGVIGSSFPPGSTLKLTLLSPLAFFSFERPKMAYFFVDSSSESASMRSNMSLSSVANASYVQSAVSTIASATYSPQCLQRLISNRGFSSTVFVSPSLIRLPIAFSV